MYSPVMSSRDAGSGRHMTETQREAQQGVDDALHDLSDNSRALIRHEIEAAQQEMRDKAKQALPAAGLLAVAGAFGLLSAASIYRLSLRLLEKNLPPATAACTAAAGYGVIAGAAGAAGVVWLRELWPLVPAETARETADTARTVAGTAARAASG